MLSSRPARGLARISLDDIRHFRQTHAVNFADHAADFVRDALRLFFVVEIDFHFDVNVRPPHAPMIR